MASQLPERRSRGASAPIGVFSHRHRALPQVLGVKDALAVVPTESVAAIDVKVRTGVFCDHGVHWERDAGRVPTTVFPPE